MTILRTHGLDNHEKGNNRDLGLIQSNDDSLLMVAYVFFDICYYYSLQAVRPLCVSCRWDLFMWYR